MPNLSGTTAALGSGDGVELATEPGQWDVQNTPAPAAVATASRAAAVNTKHVCKSISASIACGATAQTPIRLVLRDGLTGAGTIRWSKKLSAPVNGMATVDVTGLCIVGSDNTAMTLEFVVAGVAASEQDVFLGGLDITGK